MKRPISVRREQFRVLTWSCCLSVVIFQASGAARADDRFWIDPGGGSFYSVTNWQNGAIPLSGDVAHFGVHDNSSHFLTIYTVSFTGDANNFALQIEDDFVTFDLNGHTYKATASVQPSPILIGNQPGQGGGLVITDGTVSLTSTSSLTEVDIGAAANASGNLTVSTDGQLNAPSAHMLVGDNGTGFLTVNNGGQITTADTVIGFEAQSPGTLTVTGAGSTLTNTGDLRVGHFSPGTMTISNGALFAPATVQDHNGFISNGTATVTGFNSRWINSGDLTVGDTDTGTLNINTLGIVQDVNAIVGDFGSEGHVVVGDEIQDIGISQWINSGTLTIGRSGSAGSGPATLDLAANAHVENTDGIIAADLGSIATVTINGPNSEWVNTGNLTVGDSGQGTLDIAAGTVESTNGFIAFESSSEGTVLVHGANAQWINSGRLSVGVQGPGTLSVTENGLVQNTDGYIAESLGSVSVVTLNGSGAQWINTGELMVGQGGNGTLNVTAGTVQNGDGTIGDESLAAGTVMVDGANSTWINTGQLFVGDFGHGTLNITGGGSVEAATSTLTPAIIGNSTGSNGAALVDGPGSNLTLHNDLFVGGSGAGQLDIQNSGTVSNVEGKIGLEPGSTSTVNVTGGSTWTNSADLAVGDGGSGTLNILAGGAVSCLDTQIAQEHNSVGVVNVAGAGSTWTNNGNLVVGSGGMGTLMIAAGGSVSNQSAILGELTGSSGTVTVTGAGSTWTNSGNGVFDVGQFGTGALTIEAGGRVSNPNGFIGTFENSTGTATVSGAGSSWMNSAFFAVGHGGNGTLTIAAGGSVSSPRGFIGNGANSIGTVTVTGVDSTWANSDVFVVGFEGLAELMILSGGSVSSGNSWLAGATTSAATATVSGTGSNWTIVGRFAIGEAFDPVELGPGGGTGTLNIQPGGTVSVAQDTALFPGGKLSLEGGTLDAASVSFQGGGAFDFLGGTLHVGTFNGSLTNHGGTLAPGHSAGSTTIVGNYTQKAGAKLELEIGGNSADFVGITGNANLGGQLQLAMLGGFLPGASDTFAVLNAAGGIFGVFTNVATGQRLTTSDGNGSFLVQYGVGSPFNQNQIVLSAFEAVLLPGDYNGNNVVDAADYTLWRNTLGQMGMALAADGNGNGTIDAGDYDVWKLHFGQTAGVGSGASANAGVPEPATLVLFMFAAAGRCLRRGRDS